MLEILASGLGTTEFSAPSAQNPNVGSEHFFRAVALRPTSRRPSLVAENRPSVERRPSPNLPWPRAVRSTAAQCPIRRSRTSVRRAGRHRRFAEPRPHVAGLTATIRDPSRSHARPDWAETNPPTSRRSGADRTDRRHVNPPRAGGSGLARLAGGLRRPARLRVDGEEFQPEDIGFGIAFDDHQAGESDRARRHRQARDAAVSRRNRAHKSPGLRVSAQKVRLRSLIARSSVLSKANVMHTALCNSSIWAWHSRRL